MNKNFKWLFLVSLTFMACNDDDTAVTEEPVSPGTANFSKYVALGDSFAAGYSDNALFQLGQETSYPNILAGQLVDAGGSTIFNAPWCESYPDKNNASNKNIGGLLLNGNVIQGPRLYWDGSAPVTVSGTPTTEVLNKFTQPVSNFGVPGAKSYHLLAAGYGNVAGISNGSANPYFARFASSASTTVLADALTQQPTFFSLWIGGNDVLGYALAGGVGANHNATGNTNPATYQSSDITHNAVFNTVFNTLVDQLSAGGKKGVVANLPYITTLPHFTTVPYNPVNLSAAQVTQLNAGYAAYNGGLVTAKNAGLITEEERIARTVTFQVGLNPVVIVDEYLTDLSALGLPSYRPATAADYLVLPSSAFIGTLVGGNPAAINGVSVPLADKWVVSKKEVDEIKVATDSYNATIKSAATAKGLAFVDAAAIMDQLCSSTGLVSNGYTMKEDFVTGGFFSLDGVHPSPRGYALIANKFIEAINKEYKSTLKTVNIGTYRILFPSVL